MKNINRLAWFAIFPCLVFLLDITATTGKASTDKILRVGVPNSFPAFSFIEPNEDVPKGFSVDLAELLADTMGMKAKIFLINEPDLLDALNNDNVDMIIDFMDESYSTTDTIRTSVKMDRNYFVNSKLMPFTLNNDLHRYVIAIEKGQELTRLFPSTENIKYIEAGSQKEALALVDSGKADIYISFENSKTGKTIEDNRFRNISMVPIGFRTDWLVLAVKKDNTELFTGLSIAYGKIIQDESYHKIYSKWLTSSLKFFLRNNRKYIEGIGLFMFFALSLPVIWNFMLKRKVLQVTKNLQVSEQKYKDLIELSPDMVHLVSGNGNIKFSNKIALAKLGYDIEKTSNQKLSDFVLPAQAEELESFIEKVFDDGYANRELTFKSRDGNLVQVDIAGITMKDPDIEKNFACCFSRDTTERKRLEENLMYSDRLAIIGKMAAGIAHEINNPLWVILSNAEDALTHKLSHEELYECLKSIERNGARAAKSIEDLLTFARPAPMRFETIDLIKLIEESMLLLSRKLKEKNIQIEKRYPSNPIFLLGDDNSIQQLLFNIILNAIQALDNNGLITISLKVKEKNGGGEIELEIGDNGNGISADDLQFIFNPFFTSGKTNGFGLGLFMSRMIVEKHNGSLSVRSKLGEGTVFTVCFPFRDDRKLELQNSIY